MGPTDGPEKKSKAGHGGEVTRCTHPLASRGSPQDLVSVVIFLPDTFRCHLSKKDTLHNTISEAISKSVSGRDSIPLTPVSKSMTQNGWAYHVL